MRRTLLTIALLFTGLVILPSFTPATDNPLKTVLLIPYQPVMHLSDADADIAGHSKINPRQVRTVMRNSIIERLALRLRENFYVQHLTEIGTAREKDDLTHFYNSESFYLTSRDTGRKLLAGESSETGNPYFGIFRKNSSPRYESSYMNVSIKRPELIRELAATYEADYFLVLTQFEIKTHYNECIDIANHVFRREFLLHFAIFDAEGNQTGGTAVSYDAGSDVNTVNKITYDIFPELVTKVCSHVSATASR